MPDVERPTAEETIRALAAAADTARLYPPSSDLPRRSLEHMLDLVNRATSEGESLRFYVDPQSFRIKTTPVASSHPRTVALAERLHALQVGQLIISHGATMQEAEAFVSFASADPAWVRERGGARAVLKASGVRRIAVVEVTLRASTKEGASGLDLINSPLDEIAHGLLGVARGWSLELDTASAPPDNPLTAIETIAETTREIAMQRIVRAVLSLSDAERVELLSAALRNRDDARMAGLLGIVSRLSPTTLARLLRLTSETLAATPDTLMSRLELDASVAQTIAALLAPSPRSEGDCGVPAEIEPARLAHEASLWEEPGHVTRLIADSEASRATRALATSLAILRTGPKPARVEAVGVALGPAARAGSFVLVREALRALDELAHNPLVSASVAEAHATIHDPALLAKLCAAVADDASAAIVGELLASAGQAGAEVVLAHTVRADDRSRSLFRPVLRRMEELVLATAARRMRSDSPRDATTVLSVVTAIGTPRVVTVVEIALEHLDAEVRRSAVSSLAQLPSPDARRSLARVLTHWDPETRRFAVREVGRTGAIEAIPALTRILENINVFERDHELKKEVIKCLESLGSTDALPVLARWARRRFILGQKSRELRYLAAQAVERLSAHPCGKELEHDERR